MARARSRLTADVYRKVLQLDANKFAVVSYQNGLFGPLKLLRCGDTNCTAAIASVTTVDASASLGAYTSLFVSANQAVRPKSSAKPASDGMDDAESTGESDEDTRLFALGRRSLADLIAPDSFEVRADHIRLDGQYARVLSITGYPRLVSPGWLSVLVETDLPIEVRSVGFGELEARLAELVEAAA